MVAIIIRSILIAWARNLYLWIKMPRGSEFDRLLDDAWQRGYSKVVATGMQSGRNLPGL